ncbi:MAG: tRNA lysidine(34) synthetase TilS [Alphaproteobacteria bacterium]
MANLSNAVSGRFADALNAALGQSVQNPKSAKSPDSKITLITALSGGPDSTALALLADDFARARGYNHHCIVIDHALRPESGAEATRVAHRMQALGIACKIAKVTATPPRGGIQNWAREQRYELLANEARRANAVLLFAHHAGDQAETVFMRLGKGSGLYGLAGMTPVRWHHGIPILRPLLDWSAGELVGICHEMGCDFETDPSNKDHRFERVRTRRQLALMQASGIPMDANLNHLAGLANRLCQCVDGALRRHLNLPSPHPHGYMSFDLADYEKLPDDLWRRLIARAMTSLAGEAYPPANAAFVRLRASLRAGKAVTLGGCRFIRLGQAGEWGILPEPGRHPAIAMIDANVPIVFAKSWRIISPCKGRVRWLGDLPPPPDWIDIKHAVRQSLPVVETLDGRVLYPQLNTENKEPYTNGTVSATFLALANDGKAITEAWHKEYSGQIKPA